MTKEKIKDKKGVMSIICHKCALSNNLWKKNISEEFECLAGTFTM